MPKYPKIKVQLVGEDGNGFMIVNRVRAALRKAGLGDDVVQEFTKQATSGDYDNLLATCAEWVKVK